MIELFSDCNQTKTYLSQYFSGAKSTTDPNFQFVNPTLDQPATGIDANLTKGGLDAVKHT